MSAPDGTRQLPPGRGKVSGGQLAALPLDHGASTADWNHTLCPNPGTSRAGVAALTARAAAQDTTRAP